MCGSWASHSAEFYLIGARSKKWYASGFNISFLSGVVKIYPLGILCWVNKDKNRAQQMFSAL